MNGTLTQDEAVVAAHENLVRACSALARATGGGEVWERDGLAVAASGAPMTSFNNVLLTGVPTRPERALAEVCAYFRERGLRFRLRVREGAATFAEELLSAVGLVHKRGIPCLVLRPLRNEGVAPALTVRTVEDDATLRDHTEVVAAGFGWEPDVLARVFSTRLVADPSWRGYTGYLDGRPVASSQLFVTEGVAGIYYVATLAESRRRGFGEAMTRHALNEGAAAGCTMASLQASPMGEPVYRRMGFEQVSYYRTYVPQEG